jgi:hypothetical protein
MASPLSALALAGVNRVADAGATETAAQATVELRRTPLAIGIVKPWSFAAEVNPRPRDVESWGEPCLVSCREIK